MTIALRAAGTIVHAATSVTPAYPAGITAGDIVFLGAAWKLDTATAPTLSGWTVVIDRTVGSGSAGVGTGPQRIVVWRKDTVAGGESGTVTVTPSGTVNVVSAAIIAFSKTAASWNPLYESGSDTTAAANLNFTAGSVIGETTGDLMVGCITMGDNTNLGSQTFAATGATFGTAVEHVDAGSALGNAQRFSWISRPITAGPATAATAYSATAAGSHTGGGVFVRLREATGTPATAAGSITLGGSATGAAGATAATAAGSITLGGSATGAQSTASISTLVDDFATADTGKWQFSPTTGVVTGGQLVLTPTATSTNFIRSQSAFDLTGSSFVVELVQPPDVGTGTVSTHLTLQVLPLSAADALRIQWDNNFLRFQKSSGVPSFSAAGTAVAYNATSHRWLRIREDAGTVYYETSPDASTWTQRGSYVPVFAVTSMYVRILAGYSGTEPTPGTAIWDNVNSAPTGTAGTASGSVTLAGSASAQAAASATGSITLGGPASGQGTASAAGSITLAGSGTARAAVTASGSVTLTGTATARAATTASGSVTLGGSATARAAITASGSVTLGGSGTARAATTATGSITLGGNGTSGQPGSTAAGSITLSGAATARAATTSTGSISLSGAATARAATTSAGVITLAGTATARAASVAAGTITLGGSATGDAASDYNPHTYVTFTPATNGVSTFALQGDGTSTIALAPSAATFTVASSGASTLTLTGNGVSTLTLSGVGASTLDLAELASTVAILTTI